MALHEKICCVPNCGKTRADDIILHSFPNPNNEYERFLTWTQAIGPSVSSLNDQYIFKYRRVCHTHFDEKYITWTRRLSPNAVPSQLIPGHQFDQSARDPMIDDSTVNTDEHQAEGESGETSNRSQTTKTASRKMPFLDDRKAMRQTIYKLSKKKQSYAARLKSALNLGENKSFQNAVQKFTTLAALFTIMQFREIKKNKMGRRFTQPEKIMALSLYKRSPRTYRWLKSIFVLPSPLTLNRLITKANLRPGINENLFKQLKRKTQNMKEDDKLCILLFDEVSIAPHFDYNLRKDFISGFVNNGVKKQKRICNHSLVFMIRGIQRNYKQPVSYSFCSGTTNKEELAKMIKNVIRKLHSVGLRVLATVCDQGTSNVSAVNILLKETRDKEEKEDTPYFLVDDQKVVPLYDPPHLIKGIRNNLLEKDLKCTIDGKTKIAKWNHVIQFHNEDPAYKGIRLVKKLTEQHIKPDNFQKMKVKYATQVISQRVAVTMGYLAVVLPVFSYGTAVGWLSPMGPRLINDKELSADVSADVVSWMASVVYLVGTPAVFLYGYIVDNYGRKRALMLTSFSMALCWGLKLYSTSTWALITARAIVGLGVSGSYVVTPLYIKEISEDSIRGTLGSLVVLSQNLGNLLVYVMGEYLSYHAVLWICLAVPLVHLLVFATMPDTPSYLLKCGRIEEARDALAWLRCRQVSETAVDSELKLLLIELEQKNNQQFKHAIKTLAKDRSTFRAFRIVLTITLARELCGCLAVLHFASQIFYEANQDGGGWVLSANQQAAVLGAVQLFGSVTASSLVERTGRKPLLAITCLVSGVAMGLLGGWFAYGIGGWVPVAALCLCIFCDAAGLQPVPFVVMTEMFSFQLRGTVTSLVIAFACALVSIELRLFHPLSQLAGLHTVFFLFAGVCLVSTVYIFICVPETKMRTIDEIYAEIGGKNHREIKENCGKANREKDCEDPDVTRL